MPRNRKRYRTSVVWQYFTDIDTARSIAQCDKCGKQLSYKTTTTNLIKHLERVHPTVPIKKRHFSFKAETESSQEYVDSKEPTLDVQEPISHECASSDSFESNVDNEITEDIKVMPSKISATTDKRLLNAFGELFYIDLKPFSIVEDRGFKNFVTELNPDFVIPSKKHITDVLIPAAYTKCMEDAKNIAIEIRSASLTVYTSMNEDSFNAITAHFIDENFYLKRLLLECDALSSRNNASALAEEISRIVTAWDLSSIICLVTTDSTANITSAIRDNLKWNHYTCFSHTLDLIIRDGFKKCESLIAKVRAIVKYFKRSPLATYKLSEAQKQLGVAEKKLLEDDDTHLGSVFQMLERVNELEQTIKSILDVLDNNIQMLTHDEWLTIEDLIKIFKPFERAMKVSNGEGYFPASLVIVISNGLLDVCKNLMKTSSSPIVLAVLKDLITSINTRLGNVENSEILSLCTFLDPRFKIFAFNSSEAAEKAKSAAMDEVCGIIETEQGPYTYKTSTDDEKEKKNDENDEYCIWRALSRKVAKECDKFKGTPRSISFLEIQKYMEDEVPDRKKDPVEWWRNKRHQYPYLSQVVRMKFCAMGTTVPYEKLFSTTHLVVSQTKSTLNSEIVKKLIFLNVNNSFMKL